MKRVFLFSVLIFAWVTSAYSITKPDYAFIANKPFVSAKEYGAVGDGTTDDTVSIQAALNTGNNVQLSSGTYKTTSSLTLARGQVLAGVDYNKTIISFSAATGTPVILADKEEIEIRDIYINGNSVASYGIKLHNGASTGTGLWRQMIKRCKIDNISGTAIELGSGSFPLFCHDAIIDSTFILRCDIGISGIGAIYSVKSCTFSGMRDRCINALSGSAWTISDSIFSGTTGWDIVASNTQLIRVNGSWFEDNTLGIYAASTAHSLSMSGCYLHTKSTTCAMDMNNAAGAFSITGSPISSTSSSSLVINQNGSYRFSLAGSGLNAQNGFDIWEDKIRADNFGFSAYLNVDVDNITGDASYFDFLASPTVFAEIFDSATSFDATTGVFTAPVNGNFEFSASVEIGSCTASATTVNAYIVIGSFSTRIGTISGAACNADGSVTLSGTARSQMATGDKAFIRVQAAGTTKTLKLFGAYVTVGTYLYPRTTFTGRMN